MADLTITISNGLQMTPEASLWNVMEWGNDNWTTTGDMSLEAGKWLSESVTFTDLITGFSISKFISNGLTLTSSINFGSLSQGIWDYVIKGATDLDDRNCPTWSEQADQSDGFIEESDPPTTWTEG